MAWLRSERGLMRGMMVPQCASVAQIAAEAADLELPRPAIPDIAGSGIIPDRAAAIGGRPIRGGVFADKA